VGPDLYQVAQTLAPTICAQALSVKHMA